MKAAVLGTERAGVVGTDAQILLDAVKSGLQQQTGYVAGVDGSPLPEPIVPRGDLVPVNDCVMELDILAKWCEGRAWLAGSAALWRYEFLTLPEDVHTVSWAYGDCDLFAVSEQAYADLKVELESLMDAEVVETPSNCRFERVWIDNRFYESVNLVRPLPKQNWEHPSSVLATFDLSICAVALGPGWLYALYPHDIERKRMRYMGHGRNAMRLLSRIFKYLNRGYKCGNAMIETMLEDDKVADAVWLLNDMNTARSNDKKHFTAMLQHSHNVIEELYSATYWDWDDIETHDDDDDFNDWY